MKSSLHSLIPFLPFLLSYSTNCQLRTLPQFYLSERVRVTLRLAVYCQKVRLGVRPLETHDQYFFQLNTCSYNPYVTCSLTRGWVCRLQLLLVLASAVILGPSPAGLITLLYCLRFETPPTWRARSPFLYPPGTGLPSYTPRHWVRISSPATTRRTTVKVFEPASSRVFRYIASVRPSQKIPLFLLLRVDSLL
jgi:hypothetical protein